MIKIQDMPKIESPFVRKVIDKRFWNCFEDNNLQGRMGENKKG